MRAFKQRYERLVAFSARASLERLCEQVVCEHDYDLAVLARWDGKRRYANLRKLMRLARSYEELRGRDIEGFVRFIRDQEALGAAQLEAVSEEEGADAVRLLTIHGAKGLEFKVVVVADAGRDTGGRPAADEILARADGRFGFKVVHPTTGEKHAVFDYEGVRPAGQEAEAAERLRLYYVAMTRAIDRLIVSGAIDESRTTPIGWVLSRLDCERGARGRGRRRSSSSAATRGSSSPSTATALARPRLRRRRNRPVALEDGSSRSSPSCRRRGRRRAGLPAARARAGAAAAAAPRPAALVLGARALRPLLVPLLRRARRGPARAARRGAGGEPRPRRDRDRRRRAPAARARRPARPAACPTLEPVRDVVPGGDRRRSSSGSARSSRSYCDSALARRVAALDARAAPSGRSRSSTTASSSTAGSTSSTATARARSSSTTRRTRSRERTPEEIVESDYRLQQLVYALACFRAGAEEVEVVYAFLERPDAVVSTTFARARAGGARARAVGGDRADRRGRVRPDAERVHVPRLPGARRRLRRAAARRRRLVAAARGVRDRLTMPRSYVHEARRRVGPKRARIRPIIERLAVEHADARIALRFDSPLELLVSVMLSAQTTDVNVNRVTTELFRKYRRPEDYLAVPQEELERDIFATGFYRQKAKSLRGTMRMLIEELRRRGADRVRRAPAAAGRRAQDRERRLGRARQRARESSSTRTCAGSRSGSG